MIEHLFWLSAIFFVLGMLAFCAFTLLALANIGTGIYRLRRSKSRLGKPHHTCERRFGLAHFYRTYGKGDK